MDTSNIPKILTPEVIESVLSNEEALKKLFHLEEEECFLKGDSCRIAWNSKMIKLLLCDVKIHVKNPHNDNKNNKTLNTDDHSKIHITVSDLSNKKNIEVQSDEINKINESISLINEKIENIQTKLKKFEFLSQSFKDITKSEKYPIGTIINVEKN